LDKPESLFFNNYGKQSFLLIMYLFEKNVGRDRLIFSHPPEARAEAFARDEM